MIIQYELQGSKTLHKGVFETDGFWCRFEEERELVRNAEGVEQWDITGYKMFSHCSFSFFHEDKAIVEEVYSSLLAALGHVDATIDDVGFICEVY